MVPQRVNRGRVYLLLGATEPDGVRQTDLLVLKALLVFREIVNLKRKATAAKIRRARESYAAGLNAVLQADEPLNAGRHRKMNLASFSKRGIQPPPSV